MNDGLLTLEGRVERRCADVLESARAIAVSRRKAGARGADTRTQLEDLDTAVRDLEDAESALAAHVAKLKQTPLAMYYCTAPSCAGFGYRASERRHPCGDPTTDAGASDRGAS